MKTLAIALVALGASSTFLISTPVSASSPIHSPQDAQSLETILRDRPYLSTFRELAIKAGVSAPLRTPGSENQGYTIFVPSNNAFAKLPPQVLEELGKDPQLLEQVVKFHILAGRVSRADLKAEAETLQGEKLGIMTSDSRAMVGNAYIIEADQKASNGVIHIIDRVLLPPTLQNDLTRRAILPLTDAKADWLARQPDPIETSAARPGSLAGGLAMRLSSTSNLSTLNQLILQAGLGDTLANGNHTLFAPTNAAFDALPRLAKEAILGDPVMLREVLLHHVLGANYEARQLRRQPYRNEAGALVLIKVGANGAVKFGDAVVLEKDLRAEGSTIHVINRVVIPVKIATQLRMKGITVDD